MCSSGLLKSDRLDRMASKCSCRLGELARIQGGAGAGAGRGCGVGGVGRAVSRAASVHTCSTMGFSSLRAAINSQLIY